MFVCLTIYSYKILSFVSKTLKVLFDNINKLEIIFKLLSND